MALDTNQKVGFVAAAAAVLPFSIAAIGLYGTQRLMSDSEWVHHSHQVRVAIEEVGRHIDGAKADVRGFLLTGDSTYLARHVDNINDTESAFQRLLQLTNDNPDQQTRFQAARSLLTERELALQKTVALGYRPGRDSIGIADRLAIGERLTDRIDSVLAAGDAEEARLLDARLAHQRNSERLLAIASIALAITGVGFAWLFRRSIRHDLVGRSQAEAELRASEAKFAGILDIAVDGVITVDERQTIVHFNRGAETIFGYHRTEVIGQPLEKLLPARHAHAHAGHLHAFAASPETSRRMGERRQINGRGKNGDEFPAEASISKLHTPSGWLFTAVVRDVTESRQREAHEHALVTASGDLAAAPEYAATLSVAARLPVPAVGAWSLLDLLEPTESGERALRRTAGAHPDPDVQGTLREIEALGIDDDSPEPSIDVLRTGEARTITPVNDEWLDAHLPTPRHAALFRALAPASLLVVPLVGHDTVLGVWTIGASVEHHFDRHDEALAKALAERAALAIQNARLLRTAQNATAARDKVLGVVSHDLRNPLSAVTMLARRLVDEPATQLEQRTTGASILSAVDWMHRLIQDLLDIASIEVGRLSVELEPQSIAAIVEAGIAMFQDRARERDVRLVPQVTADGPLVLADGARVVQALANLVGNALKFTAPRGTVEVGARVDEDHMLVWVRDDGAGIPAAELPHVFDRFWHARRGSSQRGYGLGLAITQGIVKAHGGRIWAESVVGEGSTFFFTLPLVSSRTVTEPPAGAFNLTSDRTRTTA
jgi:PAS domain S-box-containing protein